MVEDELNKITEYRDEDANENTLKYVAIRFNSWQYQGFEDAKIALMSAIVSQLEKKAGAYCKEHKIENGIEKIQEIGKRLWKNEESSCHIPKLIRIKSSDRLRILFLAVCYSFVFLVTV